METGPHMLTSEDRTWGMLAHLLAAGGYFLGLLAWAGPLVVWLVKRNSSPFAAYHGLQSLYFQLVWMAALTVGWIVTVVLMMLLVGFLLIPVMCALTLVPVIWAVVAGVKANAGEWYEYPLAGRWAARTLGM